MQDDIQDAVDRRHYEGRSIAPDTKAWQELAIPQERRSDSSQAIRTRIQYIVLLLPVFSAQTHPCARTHCTASATMSRAGRAV